MTFDIEASWLLNLLCNFECSYCASRAPIEHPLVGRLTPEQYLDFFNSTGKTWMIHFTGGEPFFYPDFLRLCQTLTSRHYISINSNLSAPRVRDFAANVDASRVQFIHCAVHVEQRDRRKGWGNLQTNVTALLESGFPLFASLVMTPAAFAEFPRVAEWFASLGVPLIPKAIRGAFERRWYPQAYSAAERAQFRRFSEKAELTLRTAAGQPFRHHPTINPLLDRDYIDGIPDFTGISCSAGRTFVSIGYDGNISRCGQKTLLGNIFERRLDLFAEDRPCDDEFCPYYCTRYSRFKNEALAEYPLQTAPHVFKQALIIIRGVRRQIGNRIADASYPPRP
ncbi:MAG: radical SAM protein [Bryobacteraceae bacterium]|jgi:MoaA/NifB/PqqE/SkfB family radical SAM enzyme